MNAVVGRPDNNSVWADINALAIKADKKKALIRKVREQVRAGEARIGAQNLDRLKGT